MVAKRGRREGGDELDLSSVRREVKYTVGCVCNWPALNGAAER